MARLELIALEMPAIVQELKIEAKIAMERFKWDEKQTRGVYNRSVKKQWSALIERENCHPAKTIIVLWGQIPLWICQSIAIRNLVNMFPDPASFEAQMVKIGLSVGGFGWIPNLTMNDGSLILPITMAMLNLAIIEVQILRKTTTKAGKIQQYATWFFRGVSIVMILVAASVPSCLVLYWTTSSAAQNLLLMSPKFKNLTGIPTNVNSHIEYPYQYMAAKFMERIHLHTGKERFLAWKK